MRAGYIVTGDMGAMELALRPYHDSPRPRGGILVSGDVASVFTTRKRAKGAIARTRRYAAANNYRWASSYRISRLEPAP